MVTVTLASADTLRRGGGGDSWTSVDYPWMVTVTLASADTLTRGGGDSWTSVDYPWMVTVTLASADTLTRGGGGGGWTSLDYPWMVTVTLASADTLTRGGEGWTSLDYPWMVTVTLASADTLTRVGGGGGRVVIPGLSMDGHCYSGIRGYSDKGGGGKGWTSLDYPWMVTVTLASADTLTRGGRGKGGHPWTIHGWSLLLWHPRIL